jgi:hypothetical protein
MTKYFKPWATPAELLRMGIFDGQYFADDPDSCPIPLSEVKQTNRYKPNISQSREHWLKRRWITPHDPLGWFQWYCRYHAGRRIHELDSWQITRWHNFRRHSIQVLRYGNGDPTKRRGQRQALLHWAHNPEPDGMARSLDHLGIQL